MAQASGTVDVEVTAAAERGQAGARDAVVWTAGVVDAAFVVGIALVALFLRTIELSDYPFGLHGDEAWNGLDARAIIDGRATDIWPYTTAALGQPAGPMFLTVPFEWAFGPSILAVRLPQALIGVCTVILGFFAMRELFSRPAAYVWAFLAAFSSWLVFYNRTGFTVSAMPFTEVASLLAVAVALKKRAWPWYLGAGIVVGAGLYGYYSYPLFAVGLGVWVLVHFAIERPRPAGLHARNVAVMGLAALLVVMPARDFFDSEGNGWRVDRRDFSVRSTPEYQAADTVWEKVEVYGENGERLVKSLLGRDVADISDGSGDTPAIDDLMFVVFVAGMVASAALAAKRRRAAYLLPFIMIPIILIGPMYSTLSYHRRSLGIAVFVFMAASVALSLGFEQLRARGARWLIAGSVLAGLLAVYYAGTQTYRYFGETRDTAMMRNIYAPELTIAVQWLDEQPPDVPIYFFADRWSVHYETPRYLLKDHVAMYDQTGHSGQGELGVPDVAPTSRAVIMLLGTYIKGEDANVHAKYPEATRYEGPRIGGGEPSFVAYVLSGDQL